MPYILFIFGFSCFLSLSLPLLFPSLMLSFFASPLILIFDQKNKLFCLWVSLFCGLFMDLLSAEFRFGLYALNYCLTTYCLYPFKRYFFEDSLIIFPLMTFLFVALSNLIQLSLYNILGHPSLFSWNWIVENLMTTPFYNSLYSIFTFTFLFFLFPKKGIKRKSTMFSLKGSS